MIMIKIVILLVWSVDCGLCKNPPMFYPTIVPTEEICEQREAQWAELSPDHRSKCYVIEIPAARVRVKETVRT